MPGRRDPRSPCASRPSSRRRGGVVVTVEKYLIYRGEVKAAVGVGGALAFVTAHPEGHPPGLYRLAADALTLSVAPLPAGAVAIVSDGPTLWAAGTDGRVYERTASGGTPKPIGAAF